MQTKSLVLASTSPFRRALLEKLNLAFVCAKPNTDETEKCAEQPQDLVMRLSLEKAQAVSAEHKNALIIGSDQVAVCDGKIIGKPHTFENAVKQLTAFSGQAITFFTGLTILDTTNNSHSTIVAPFTVHFKKLTQVEIINYVKAEQPLNCAGSFKSEGLGICLFEKFEGDDPNALIGLPLIKLVELLKHHGLDVLANQPTS